MSTPPTGEEPPRGPFGPPGYGQQPPPTGFGPPPYGQYGGPVPPAWQPGPPPPATPPRDRTRTALIVALVVVGLAIAAGAALLIYVLSSTRLDRAAVERDVAAQFEERNGVKLSLECRHRMIVRPGADYECRGTTADGEEVEIQIMITDKNGAYTWAED
jgi:hypothetical protein